MWTHAFCAPAIFLGFPQIMEVVYPVIPPRASELLARIARRGAAGMPLVFRGAGKPLLKTLVKSEKRRI